MPHLMPRVPRRAQAVVPVLANKFEVATARGAKATPNLVLPGAQGGVADCYWQVLHSALLQCSPEYALPCHGALLSCIPCLSCPGALLLTKRGEEVVKTSYLTLQQVEERGADLKVFVRDVCAQLQLLQVLQVCGLQHHRHCCLQRSPYCSRVSSSMHVYGS